jgi:hypothetical protein
MQSTTGNSKQCRKYFPDECGGCIKYRESYVPSQLMLMLGLMFGLYPQQAEEGLKIECRKFHRAIRVKYQEH